MSRVTNVIVTAHVGPGGDSDFEIASANRYLRESEAGGGGEFREVTEQAGGTKHMECRVYLSTFNHADTNVILDAIDQVPWYDKEMVQVFVKEQEDEVFSLRYSGCSKKNPVTVDLTPEDLKTISNALNEVCNCIQPQGEFDTRMGCTVNEARALLAKLHAIRVD